MKLPKISNEYNPLKQILTAFPYGEKVSLDMEHMTLLKDELEKAQIECADYAEVFVCLDELRKMGLLAMEEHPDNKGHVSYTIERLHNEYKE